MFAISAHPGDTFARAGGVEEGFALLKRAGIEGIQLGLGAVFMPSEAIRSGLPCAMDAPLEDLYALARPYKEAAKKHGVAISQVHAPYPSWILDDEAANARMQTVLRKSIALTAYLESPHCIIHPAFTARNRDRFLPDAEWSLNRQLYAALIPDLRRHKVMALLENMFNRDVEGMRFAAACSDFYEAADWVDRLNALAGEELFGFCLDTGHCQLVHQNLPRAVHILGRRLKALHMQDNSGHLDDHRSPFTGTIDWDIFLDSLRAVHYQGDLNFEATNGIVHYPQPLTEAALRMLAETGRYFRQRLTADA